MTDPREVVDWEDYLRQFLKTIMGNTLPVFWLFVCQPALGVRFDGPLFWSIYAVLSIIASALIWFVCRTTPDPGSGRVFEVPTPIFGAIAATFQPIIFLCILGVYHLTK